MEMPASLPAIARRASMRALSAVSVASGTILLVISSAAARPMTGSRLE